MGASPHASETNGREAPMPLGGETLHQPLAVRLPCVKQSIMQPRRTPLPEFDCAGDNAISTPKFRQVDRLVLRVLGQQLCVQSCQLVARANYFALIRDT